MKKVFIIGNGFDLNLGLPTSYSDFIQSHHFQRNCGNGYPLFDYLKTASIHNCWVDVERELVTYAKKNPDVDKFREDYTKLRTELCDYIKNIPLNINKQSCAYNILSNFYTDEDAVVSFNYTDVCETILKENNRKANITYIHGLNKNNNIIFGVHDDYDRETKYPFLLKSLAKNYAGNRFNEILSEADCFIFFGHSLGETDKSYFQDYISIKFLTSKYSGKNLVFSYFGENGRENLAKILNEKNKMGLAKLKQNMKYFDFDASNIKEMTDIFTKF